MSTIPKSPFSMISLLCKQKPLRVVLLGQCGVGKTALVVRFVTRRFIEDYDPNLEKVYNFHSTIGEEMLSLDILDTAGHYQDKRSAALEVNIRWGDAFILMYSVTDKCSFDECNRLKFLINYNKNRKKRGSLKESTTESLVALVGNKNDQLGERMISFEEGLEQSKEMGCFCFHEISVRESISEVNAVFMDLWYYWKIHFKSSKVKRYETDMFSSSVTFTRPSDMKPSTSKHSCFREQRDEVSRSLSTEDDKTVDSEYDKEDILPPFRGRASTDGFLLIRSRQPITPRPALINNIIPNRLRERRMSISMRGNDSTY